MPPSSTEGRAIAVLTTGRQDWGILRSTCLGLARDPRFRLRLLVGGMHCSAAFGLTRRLIEAEGIEIAGLLSWIPDDRVPAAWAQAAGALGAVGEALARAPVTALLVAGDRFETAAAALAATLAATPVVHLHGGEETEGSMDNALRHAISTLAHLHLVSHDEHARRLVRMGEDPATIHVVGAPGLDNLHRDDLASREELEAWLGVALAAPVVVVTLHPSATPATSAAEARAIAAAMNAWPATYVVTLPNADPGEGVVREILRRAAEAPGRVAVEALGERRFWGLLRLADALLGNSSAGLIEAAALGVPAVNVGDRQRGRLRGRNVLDVPADAAAIVRALDVARSPAFRASLEAAGSPYGDGRSATRVLDVLAAWTPPDPPLKAPVRLA